jgi:DNA-directed RNA polymerase subunit RPC12/RpoP
MRYVCMVCGQRLVWHNDRGWVHQEGGCYMMFCPDCGWKGAPYPSPIRCPACGSKKVRDAHVARPVPIKP